MALGGEPFIKISHYSPDRVHIFFVSRGTFEKDKKVIGGPHPVLLVKDKDTSH